MLHGPETYHSPGGKLKTKTPEFPERNVSKHVQSHNRIISQHSQQGFRIQQADRKSWRPRIKSFQEALTGPF